MKKNLIILVIILIFIILISAVFLFPKEINSPDILTANQQYAIDIQDEQILDNTKPFKISINYPQINGLDDFNQKAKNIVEKELENFKANSLANDQAVKDTDPANYAEYPREYEIIIGYTKGQIDNKFISIIFNVYTFEGGAHGSGYFVPLNYSIENKNEIKLADLFPEKPNYLQEISEFCIANLKTQLTKSLGSLDGTWIQDGASPKEENFKYFLINSNNTITFYFLQYQVAFGAAGDFKVIYPR